MAKIQRLRGFYVSFETSLGKISGRDLRAYVSGVFWKIFSKFFILDVAGFSSCFQRETHVSGVLGHFWSGFLPKMTKNIFAPVIFRHYFFSIFFAQFIQIFLIFSIFFINFRRYISHFSIFSLFLFFSFIFSSIFSFSSRNFFIFSFFLFRFHPPSLHFLHFFLFILYYIIKKKKEQSSNGWSSRSSDLNFRDSEKNGPFFSESL